MPNTSDQACRAFADALSDYYRTEQGRGHRCTVETYLPRCRDEQPRVVGGGGTQGAVERRHELRSLGLADEDGNPNSRGEVLLAVLRCGGKVQRKSDDKAMLALGKVLGDLMQIRTPPFRLCGETLPDMVVSLQIGPPKPHGGRKRAAEGRFRRKLGVSPQNPPFPVLVKPEQVVRPLRGHLRRISMSLQSAVRTF